MEDLKKYTPTELLKMANDTKAEHDKIKQDIINCTYQIDELEKKINDKIELLNETEKNYVAILEEINNR